MNIELNEIHHDARDMLLLDKDNNTLAQLGLTIVIYMHNAGSVAGQKNVLKIFDKFYESYKSELKSYFGSGMRRFAKLTEKSYLAKKDKLIQEAENKNKRLFLHLDSDSTGDFSSTFSITTLTGFPSADHHEILDKNTEISYLQVCFPLDTLDSKEKRSKFEDFIQSLTKKLDIYHGYAGLSIRLPYENFDYQFHEYQVTKKYWGVTPDSNAFHKSLWKSGLKTISWYTLVGKKLRNDLFIQNAERLAHHYDELEYFEWNKVSVLKTGRYPSTGNREKKLNINYLVVNHLCKQFRVKKLTDAMHSFSTGPRYSQSEGFYWLHRWDNPNFENGIFNPDGKKVELLPILVENKLVPVTGTWTPDDYEGKTVQLIEGKKFPEGEKIFNGKYIPQIDTVWRLVESPLYPTALAPSPF